MQFTMTAFFRKTAESNWFQNTITMVIIIAGILVGIETYPAAVAAYGHPLHILDQMVLWIFVLEVLVKMGAEGSKPWRYFLDPWNIFDFIIVVAAFMPFGGSSVAVLRLARLLRVLKLVRALPKLQILVGALLKSIPSMGYVSILLLLLFYVYAVAGVLFFGQNDPYHFADLQTAMLSLFRVVTLEDWTDVMYTQMFGCERYPFPDIGTVQCTNPHPSPLGGAFYFVSFVLIGTMVILNLFIGVIMNGMEEARAEGEEMIRADALGHAPTVQDDITMINADVSDIEARLHEVQNLLKDLQTKTKRMQS
ncbi:MAG: ion transporter [Leptospiraceae bacterium]|nr:ion transporter [Leptospiraceae bacterium]